MMGVQDFFWGKLENGINQFLDLDPYAKSNLSGLAGKIIAIEFTDIKLKIYLFPTTEKIIMSKDYTGEAHTVIQASSLALLNMGIRPNAEDSFFSGDVVIIGDLELGQKFRDFMGSMDVDWEEQLSHVTGDVIAHKLGDVVRQGLSWGKQTIQTLAMDTAEYMQYENHSVPDKTELNQFLADVDLIRADVDRLQARIRYVQKKL